MAVHGPHALGHRRCAQQRSTGSARGSSASAPRPHGALAFTLAALIGAFSGILIGPVTTLYYDSGFLVGLKGFVGTVVAGMVSFPLAVLGAIVVGIVESFSYFYASAFKEAIVFGLLIPFLLWRSAVEPRSHETHEHDE